MDNDQKNRQNKKAPNSINALKISQNQQIPQINQFQQQYQIIPQIQPCRQNYLHFDETKQNINYSDDDVIEPLENNEASAIYNLIENLEFTVKAQFTMGKFNQDLVQYLPAMVTLKAKEIENSNQEKEIPKVGVDLICIIDRSGSMQGEKIQMVKETLKKLLNFLTEKDRLCLIQFDDNAQRLTTLQRVSAQNKIKIEETIDSIQANGQTAISTGTHIAFKQIKKRKYRNNVTSIFLLSDGQDNSAEQSVQKQLQNFEGDTFTIHSFGFGSDHDAKMMTSLCNLKNGSFYFIKDISLLGDFFTDALGGLVSVVGKNIEIQMELEKQADNMGLKISKTYGQMWQKLNDFQYRIEIPQIAQGNRKDFVFELSLPKINNQISDNERVIQVLKANMQIKSTYTGQILKKQSTFSFTLFNQNEEIPKEKEDIDVITQYYRVKVADTIDDARRQCEKNQYQEARSSINSMITDIKKNEVLAEVAEEIIQDLEQARLGTIPQNFEQFGQQQMCQMTTNSYAQSGLNANFNEKGVQQRQIRFGTNQNKLQTHYIARFQTNIN